jgi:hypothetical protein
MPKALRSSVQKARAIAKQAPAVQCAEAKLKFATTPEKRQKAGKEFHEAMRNAILTADPTLGSTDGLVILQSLLTAETAKAS